MKDSIKIRLIHESPSLTVPESLKKTELKKTVIQALKISKNRAYQVEVLNDKGEILMKFKHTD